MTGFAQPRSVRFLGVQGTPIFREGSDDTNPGNTVILISDSVPSSKTWTLYQVLASCRMSGILEVFSGTTRIASGRSSPGSPNIFLNWFPGRPIGEGVTVKVQFIAQPNSPVAPIEAYLMGTEN